LKYGRQYFRECSGNGSDFGYSPYTGGIISFSRILNDREVLICANTSANQSNSVFAVVDENLNPAAKSWKVVFSSQDRNVPSRTTRIFNGIHAVEVTLAPMEAQILF